MDAGEGVVARQASIGGAGARFLLRLCAAACWLTAVVPVVVMVSEGLPWWACVLVEVVLLLFMVPFGFALWFDAVEHREDTERLLRHGRPAVAQVVEVELVDPGDGGADTAVVRLRVSGDDVPPFEAVHRGSADPGFVPGALFPATVDPSDNLFTLKRLRAPGA